MPEEEKKEIVLQKEEEETFIGLFNFLEEIISPSQNPEFIDLWIDAKDMPKALVEIGKQWKQNKENDALNYGGVTDISSVKKLIPVVVNNINKFSITTKDEFEMKSPPQVEAIDALGMIIVHGENSIDIITKDNSISITENESGATIADFGDHKTNIAKEVVIFLSTYVKCANQKRLEDHIKDNPSLTGLETYNKDNSLREILVDTAKRYYSEYITGVSALAEKLLGE